MILNELKQLDDISYSAIYNHIKSMRLNIIGTVLPENMFIIRARISEKEEFNSVDQLSFNKNTKKFGRANYKDNPVFYGSFTPAYKEERLNPLLTNFLELVEVLRNKEHPIKLHEYSLTIGQWKVKKNMKVGSIIYNEEYLKRNKHILGLYDLFLKNSSIEEREVLEFISGEFAKENINSENDYKISAAFAECFFDTNFYKIGALFYPSVRAQGECLNIAIKPNYVNEYLELDRVFTIDLYIQNSCIFTDWRKEASINKKSNTFKLIPMTEKGANFGRKQSLRQLEILKKNC